MDRDQMEWFVLWNDTFDEDGVYTDTDAEIGIIDRTRFRVYECPDQSKWRPGKKGERLKEQKKYPRS